MKVKVARLGQVGILLLIAQTANASIQGQALGTAAPPSSLGAFTMTAFPDDPVAVFTNVSSVASPLGGNVTFSSPVSNREIGNGWATWSHGYTGDVYYTNGLTSLGLTLPASTGAFYFYAEPNPFAVFQFTAITDSGTTLTQSADGSAGAAGFGFYTDASESIVSISISSTVDFAVGEFGIAQVSDPGVVPEASSVLTWLGLSAAALAANAKRRRRLALG
jgi:hypothetical protein